MSPFYDIIWNVFEGVNDMVEQHPKIVAEKLRMYPQIFSSCNWSLLTKENVQIANRMATLIPKVKSIPRTGKIITLEQALHDSYLYLSVIGESYVEKAFYTERGIPVLNINDGFYDYYTTIAKSLSKANEPFFLHSIKIPKQLDELSPLMIAHEHIHCLKDTYKEENKESYTYGEVIPMFLELQLSNIIDPNCRQSLIANRLFNLKNNYNLSCRNEEIIFGKSKSSNLYPYFTTDQMRYLHSYYYSLLLYERYLEDREGVLSGVRDVLDGKITTKEMLSELGLIGSFDDVKAKAGIALIKRKIN